MRSCCVWKYWGQGAEWQKHQIHYLLRRGKAFTFKQLLTLSFLGTQIYWFYYQINLKVKMTSVSELATYLTYILSHLCFQSCIKPSEHTVLLTDSGSIQVMNKTSNETYFLQLK